MARTSMMKAAAAQDKKDQPPADVPENYGAQWISEEKLNELTPGVAEDGRILLPGFGRPLNNMLEQDTFGYTHGEMGNTMNRTPNPLQEWGIEPLTVRERNMMQVVNAITDKPDWRTKVFDDTILAKWRAEAITEEGQGFTEKMFDYCVAELQDKAGQHRENDLIAVLDSEWAVVKSDSIISGELKEELKKAIAPLEEVPADAKDWHPGSNEQVLDLVHPSLFPLIYGRSRILPDSTMGLEDCIQNSGKGEIVPIPSDDDCKLGQQIHWLATVGQGQTDYWSNRFQWLPSNVAFTEGDGVKITSYINNLHPVHHRAIYPVIEKFITKSVPAWDLVLSSYVSIKHTETLRVPMTGTEYEFPLGEEAPESVREGLTEDDDEWYEVEEQWVRDNRVLIKPDAREYDRSIYKNKDAVKPISLRSHFAANGIQVIVKLANIHLTPENPEYSGGSWHIEGKLNEHICATALYYYDNENITDSHLAFRTKCSVDEITSRDYQQDDNDGVCYLFDIERNGPGIQRIGQVTTNEGRLLAFPNVLQHQVQPFKLVDPTKPGHRKILALFLVDPFHRVISTANVPPQQREWWAEAVQGLEGKLDELPPELRHQVMSEVGDFPISLEEAKTLREELMDERRAFAKDVNELYQGEEFSFCEH
ncbi:hypothetical protein E4T49_03003 [Aureobasidium sp. EXF-10728]|nr:hypothetical protein E4T49_03003 [Aureobasidium sp. EXF-10728]